MSTTTHGDRIIEVALPTRATLRALAIAESRRFARHPLFLVGATATIGITVWDTINYGHLDTDPSGMTLLPAFFLGVFGFVVAHRLTTSMRRTDELVSTSPVEQRRRTAALCLACLLPASVGLFWVVELLAIGKFWPPTGVPADAPVTWFRDESTIDVLAVLLSGAPVAALGASLLGVAAARWAPFRGSALVGVVALIAAVMLTGNATLPSALSPYNLFTDEVVEHGKMVSSTLYQQIEPAWYLLYVSCLCGLAATAALLRESAGRRRLFIVGGVLLGAALGSAALSLA
jgi:hypothetical protein